MINYYSIYNGELVCYDEGKELFWIDMQEPTIEEIELIVNKYNLPKDYIYDVQDPQEISRIEGNDGEDKAKLIMLLSPKKISKDYYLTRPMSIIIIDNIVITATNYISQTLASLKEDKVKKFVNTKSIEDFILEIAWRISESYIIGVRDLENSINEIEKEIKQSTKNELMYSMINIKKSLVNFQMAIKENGPIIDSMYTADKVFISEGRRELIKDLQIENKQARIMVEKFSIMIDNLSDLYSNIISNNLNDVMKILTSITIVLTVPTIIGGLWGMNMHLPFEGKTYAFYYLLGLSLLISFIIIYVLKKKDYL